MRRVVNKLLNKILINYPYFFAVILFAIGVATIVTRSNMFKKLLGLNIMESAVYLMFIAAGNIRGATEPIITDSNAGSTIINPLPSALMLTGIVVSVSVTAFALALILRMYKHYGTTDAILIAEMRDKNEKWGNK
ncbi:MAG: cation:proton antiporter subunit C [Clostridiales bacterium]|jgi:multicomponent Na+:H+ antiporter subunit C|nr:cation:proton antiporter subunit C [Clostridiales bacterium]